MVKLTKKDKEAIKRTQEIEAQLRASANTASKLVNSWLPSTEEDDSTKKAKEIFKGRPARLGIGAKQQHGVLSSDELRLKRKLQQPKHTIKEDHCVENNEDDDSRSSMLQNNSVAETKTKKTRTTEYLDSILTKRRRKP